MTWNYGISVAVRNGHDYWRTWFLEECEQTELFGITQRHLGLITLYGQGVTPYKEGTILYIEDAPYFRKTKTHHRVVGPYAVFSPSAPLSDVKRVFPKDGPLLVWLEDHPEKGPWLDKPYVKRIIDGEKVHFPQTASRFGFFPYRFAIRKTKNYHVTHIKHENAECWLCK